MRIGRARNLNTRLLVGEHRKPTAIESVEVSSTEMVGNADDLRRALRDKNSAVSRRLIGLARNGAASCEKQHHRDSECIAQVPNLTRPARRAELELFA